MRILKFFLKLLLWLFLLMAVTFFVLYSIAPVYDFEEPQPFSGEKIHNPYEGVDSTTWKKGNFQIQARAWMSITDGRKNDPKAVYAIYEQLGYDIITITDYMKINQFGKSKSGFIPAYEHGYGVWKTHQVCLGTDRVVWLDYPFYQNIHHKQHIINCLRPHTEVVCVVHPRVRKGYVTDDMKWLTNYDLLEAVSNYVNSLEYWDAALSAGHLVYIIFNDDSHDVLNPSKVGRFCTFVNTESLAEADILHAMKSGKAYGVKINMFEGADYFQKAIDHRNLPILKSVLVNNDTLIVEVSRKASIFTFIGAGGITKKSVTDTNRAFYCLTPEDQYVRTEIIFQDNTQFWLNPVVRYEDDAPRKAVLPEINLLRTWLQRMIALIIAVMIVVFVVKIRKARSKRDHIHIRHYFYE